MLPNQKKLPPKNCHHCSFQFYLCHHSRKAQHWRKKVTSQSHVQTGAGQYIQRNTRFKWKFLFAFLSVYLFLRIQPEICLFQNALTRFTRAQNNMPIPNNIPMNIRNTSSKKYFIKIQRSSCRRRITTIAIRRKWHLISVGVLRRAQVSRNVQQRYFSHF